MREEKKAKKAKKAPKVAGKFITAADKVTEIRISHISTVSVLPGKSIRRALNGDCYRSWDVVVTLKNKVMYTLHTCPSQAEAISWLKGLKFLKEVKDGD